MGVAAASRHYDDDALAALYAGGLDADEATAIRAHLGACESCRDRYTVVARRSDAGLEGPAAMTRRAPVTSGTFEKGQVVDGKYRIEKLLGRGGMGHVFAARHVELKHLVAIKVMRRDLIDDAEAVKRFSREAKAAAVLRDEHAVRIHDVGKLDSGQPYIVMEHLEGHDLSSLIDRGEKIPIDHAIDWILQACAAVGEAHDLGIIHRDIKPHNLFLTRDRNGRAVIKVLDFGLAKAITTSAAHEIKDSMSLDAQKAMLGTPFFMSPEQVLGAKLDHRTDVWSLAATLYHLVAGVPPFLRPNVNLVCAMIVSEDFPPLAQRRPDAPQKLEEVLRRAMQRQADQRFAHLDDFVNALRRVEIWSEPAVEETERMEQGTPTPPPPAPLSLQKHTVPMNVLPLARNPRANAPTRASRAKRRERESRRLVVVLAVLFSLIGIAGAALTGLWFTQRRR